jgi:hypothetical protein
VRDHNGLYTVFGRALEEAVNLITYDTAQPGVYVCVVLRAISFCNERSGHMARYDPEVVLGTIIT